MKVAKSVDKCPEGITTTAIPADPVIVVTEQGAFDPRELSITEHAMGIDHLAEPQTREILLKHIYRPRAVPPTHHEPDLGHSQRLLSPVKDPRLG